MAKSDDEDFKVSKKKIKSRNKTDAILNVYDKNGNLIIEDGKSIQ